MFDNEQVERANAEKNDGVARQTIGEALPTRRLDVLLHRQGPDVTSAAPIQVAGGGMVNRMFARPMAIRCEGQDPGDEPDHIIRLARREKGAMPAIVKDN